MPTSGPLPITPIPGFFPSALTMISPLLATRFQPVIFSFYQGTWNNATKLFDPTYLQCEPDQIGKELHCWSTLPDREGWAIIDDCVGGDYYLPTLDLPSGGSRPFTIGNGTPLNLQTLFQQLWGIYGLSKSYAIRYGYLWSTIEPAFLTHDYQVIHFSGWL